MDTDAKIKLVNELLAKRHRRLEQDACIAEVNRLLVNRLAKRN